MTDTQLDFGHPVPHATPDDLLHKLDKLGINTQTVEHERVFTVEQSTALRQRLGNNPSGYLSGGHSKNLFLKDKKQVLWLIVASHDRVIDLKALRKTIGAGNLSFGKPELLFEVLGVTPGSVTPFSLINDVQCRVRVILDAGLLAHASLYFHPLINSRTTCISPGDLLTFIKSCGHQPQILTL